VAKFFKKLNKDKVKSTNHGGFTLIEVMLASVLTISAIYGLSTVYLNLMQEQGRQTVLTTLSELRLSFVMTLGNPTAWGNTYFNNLASVGNSGGFQCAGFLIKNPVGCNSAQFPYLNQKRTLDVFDANNNLFFNGNLPSSGFTTAGVPCTTFTSPNPDPAGCVIGLTLNWTPICNLALDPLCQQPMVQVNGAFLYTGPYQGTINLSLSTFQNVMGAGSLYQVIPCAASGGYTGPPCLTGNHIICINSTWTCVPTLDGP